MGIDGLHRHLDSNRATFTDIQGELDTLPENTFARNALLRLLLGQHLHKPITEPNEVSLGSGHPTAGEDHVPGAVHANDRRQSVCTAGSRDNGETCFRETDDAGGREDAQVRAQRELEAAAERQGRDGGNGGDFEGSKVFEGGAEFEEEVFGPA